MKVKHILYLMLFIGVFISCKKGDWDPFRLTQAKSILLEGEWKLNSFQQDGVEKNVFIELVKTKQGSCDTQYITHIDSVTYQLFTFGKNGAYKRTTDVVRTDTSFLPSQITDTACTNKYNFLRTPFDTTLIAEGFWTFPGNTGEIPIKERIVIFDTRRDSAEIWDILHLDKDEIRLYRKYYDKNDLPVEQTLRLLPN